MERINEKFVYRFGTYEGNQEHFYDHKYLLSVAFLFIPVV